MSLPLLTFDAGQFKSGSVERGLLAAHCYAMTTAIGLDAVRRHIDPYSQAEVMEWMLYELIVEEDVGPENVGTAPSPWPTPMLHVQWAPGTFEHGLPSQQKLLTDKYAGLSSRRKVVVLLLALRVIRPRRGVSKLLYQTTDFGSGVVGSNRIGSTQPDPDDLDEWEDDLQITDAGAALNELPTDIAMEMISAIRAVDPFWPTFGKSHRVTW
ncbi:MAG: hypothetical protein ACLPKB_32855 [Xanthobacteraceae bacterium]